MIKFGALFVFVLAFAQVLGQNDVDVTAGSTEAKGATTVPLTTPTTPKITPTVTVTDKPATSEATKATTPTTTPAEAPTTQTAPPTEAPTTQQTDKSTAPAAPTTVNPDVTTSAPTAAPVPDVGNFDNGCVKINLAAQFSLFDTKTNTSTKVNLPKDSNVTDAKKDCGSNVTDTQEITIVFPNNVDKLELTFTKVDKKFEMTTITLTYDGTIYTAVNQTLFEADKDNSYVCNADQTVDFDVSQSNVTMSKVQVQAFMDSTTKDFGTAQECSQDSKTSNIVPIAVGAALAALVVIVLIAYLISRSRNQSGYESV